MKKKQPPKKQELSIAIDTNEYAGNFERAMFNYITGMTEDPGREPCDSALAQLARIELDMRLSVLNDPYGASSPLYDLIDTRLYDPGDDGYKRTCVAICPTPGWTNSGQGVHNKISKKKPFKHPAYLSVCLYVRRAPTKKELRLIQERAEKYVQRADQAAAGVTILGYRLIRTTTRETSRKI